MAAILILSEIKGNTPRCVEAAFCAVEIAGRVVEDMEREATEIFLAHHPRTAESPSYNRKGN